MFVWVIFEKCYVHSIFVTLSQQNLGCKFLLVLIWTYYWNYFLFISNNLCMTQGLQSHLGLRAKLYGMSHGSWHPCQKLGLRPIRAMGANPVASCLAQNLLGRSLKYILINSWLGSCPARLLCVWVLEKAISRMPDDSLRNSAIEHHPSLKVGISSNATLTTPHSQLNIHLAITILDLHSH